MPTEMPTYDGPKKMITSKTKQSKDLNHCTGRDGAAHLTSPASAGLWRTTRHTGAVKCFRAFEQLKGATKQTTGTSAVQMRARTFGPSPDWRLRGSWWPTNSAEARKASSSAFLRSSALFFSADAFSKRSSMPQVKPLRCRYSVSRRDKLLVRSAATLSP